MRYSIENGFLFLEGEQVEFIETPNKSTGTIVPRYAVEHFTGDNNPASTKGWFKDPDAKASAHLLIDREGKVTQFVKFTQRAWHAGESFWDGIKGLNSFSIGIELTNIGTVTKQGDKFVAGKHVFTEDQVIKATHKNETKERYWLKYTDSQLKECKEITDLLVAYYELEDVLGHDDIAPKRKNDPGPAFPMERFKPKGEIIKMYKLTANVNFRVGPGTGYKSINVIPANRIVNEVLRQGDWSRVRYSGVLGWVNNKYLIKT